MTTIDYSPLFRNSIGFDRFVPMLDSAMHTESSKSGYPPYNIKVIEENSYAITLAVAGFTENELDIQVKSNTLTIQGHKDQSDEKRHYLYQGIAERNFERKFNLADFIEVTGAKLNNGLLTVKLSKVIPEAMKPKRIAINSNQASLNDIEHENKKKPTKKNSKAEQAA